MSHIYLSSACHLSTFSFLFLLLPCFHAIFCIDQTWEISAFFSLVRYGVCSVQRHDGGVWVRQKRNATSASRGDRSPHSKPDLHLLLLISVQNCHGLARREEGGVTKGWVIRIWCFLPSSAKSTMVKRIPASLFPFLQFDHSLPEGYNFEFAFTSRIYCMFSTSNSNVISNQMTLDAPKVNTSWEGKFRIFNWATRQDVAQEMGKN